jgi:hypothetical protein
MLMPIDKNLINRKISLINAELKPPIKKASPLGSHRRTGFFDYSIEYYLAIASSLRSFGIFSMA